MFSIIYFLKLYFICQNSQERVKVHPKLNTNQFSRFLQFYSHHSIVSHVCIVDNTGWPLTICHSQKVSQEAVKPEKGDVQTCSSLTGFQKLET